MRDSTLRRDAREIFNAALTAVDPVSAVKKHVSLEGEVLRVGDRRYDLATYAHIYVVGCGKAAASMSYALEEILRKRIDGGMITVKYGHARELHTIRINEAGHPIPDEAGVKGTKEIIALLQGLGETDLVIFVISGGGSALLPLPKEGIRLEEKQRVTELLLESGASIDEINAVRKHISQVKGGQLARIAYPATLISLILSDVVGDRVDVIASGPTVPDESTFEECMRIVEQYQLNLPESVMNLLRGGLNGELEETPKPGDPIFDKTFHLLIGSNIMALKAAEQKAREYGYKTLILSSSIEGETREVAKVHTAIANEIRATGNPVPRPACIISGGETTVTITGTGLGGRNQEFVLASAIEIAGMEDTVILSCGTDGTDGPTDAAGALADGFTVHRAEQQGMHPRDYLRNNDSYHFFERLGDLIKTGPTNTNVMDVRLLLVK
ncbi:MAG: glycerate kinase [Methanophagales archaeon ANME-1-THS]|nr:MAG: glycerate kinase [Methanophagales archaeon ANME-1-THS]